MNKEVQFEHFAKYPQGTEVHKVIIKHLLKIYVQKSIFQGFIVFFYVKYMYQTYYYLYDKHKVQAQASVHEKKIKTQVQRY